MRANSAPSIPYLDDYRNSFCYDDYFESPADVKRALSGYFGLVSLFDEHLGKIMTVVRDMGLEDSTDVIYTSDHGDNLGARGLWGKSTMYEEIAGVPLICAGPSFPVGKVVTTPVSHVDAFPTIVEAVGESFAELRDDHPGRSLVRHRARRDTRAHRAERIPRHGLEHRRLHDPRRPLQIRALRELPARSCSTCRPTRRNCTTWLPAPSTRTCWPAAARPCTRFSIRSRWTGAPRRARPSCSKSHGGRDAVIARGDLGFTPAPGVAADFQ